MAAEIIERSDECAERTGRLLSEGCVGILPCDTIYGLSGIADKPRADRIYEIKRRPLSKSFIILMDKDTLQHSSLIVPDELMERWPAPFTAILKAPDGSTHAVRIPSDPFIQDVIAISGPIFSTSVNFSGEPSLLSFDDILPVFSDSVDFIVKDMNVHGGLPSTLIDATEYPFRVLRQGGYRF